MGARRERLTAGLAFAAMLVLVWLPPLLPIQDYWNHLASAWVVGHAGPGGELARWYTVRLAPVPNAATELLLAALMRATSADAAGRILLTLTLVLFVLAFEALARRGVSRLWAVPFCFSVFHAFGFLNFQLGLALALLLVALVLGGLTTGARLLLAGLLATAIYFCHAMAFAYCGLFLAVPALLRRERRPLLGLAAAFAPGTALFVRFLFLPDDTALEFTGAAVGEPGLLARAAAKVGSLVQIGGPYGAVGAFAFWAVIAAFLWRWRRLAVSNRGMAVAAWLFAALYLVIPYDLGHRTFMADWRALPFALLGLLLSRGSSAAAALSARAARALAVVTLVFHGAYAAHWSGRFRELAPLLDAVPHGSTVLPVVSLVDPGRVNPLMHLPARVVSEREAFFPYLFAYRYHLVRQAAYPGRIPHLALSSPLLQQGDGRTFCDDLYAPMAGWEWPLTAADHALACAAWERRGLAGVASGEFPDLGPAAAWFDGALYLGNDPVIAAKVAALGEVEARTSAGLYVRIRREAAR